MVKRVNVMLGAILAQYKKMEKKKIFPNLNLDSMIFN